LEKERKSQQGKGKKKRRKVKEMTFGTIAHQKRQKGGAGGAAKK